MLPRLLRPGTTLLPLRHVLFVSPATIPRPLAALSTSAAVTNSLAATTSTPLPSIRSAAAAATPTAATSAATSTVTSKPPKSSKKLGSVPGSSSLAPSAVTPTPTPTPTTPTPTTPTAAATTTATPISAAVLAQLRAQPAHYITIHIHGFPYLVTAGDTVTLPFLLGDEVRVGDTLRLTHASVLGSREYTVKGAPWIDPALFVCRATVIGETSEPMRVKEKTKRRQRRIKKVKSKHRYTVLRIKEVRIRAPGEAGEEVA